MIRLAQVSKDYVGASTFRALKDVNLHIAAGEAVAITGPSGSGKTTLLHLMGLIHKPTTGRVEIGGRDTSQMPDDERSGVRGRSIGFVFQAFHLVPHLTVLENASLPLLYLGMASHERVARAAACLERVGLGHRLHRLPRELSGGESQRAAIARALAADPPVILADEPTGNLDAANSGRIMDDLLALRDTGKTLVVITHDQGIAARFPRRITIFDGNVGGGGA
ncbi:MAG: ABC transporter ATP-binding protein [Kiritimatiellia bacterium]